MILVTGASGQLGRLVVAQLLKQVPAGGIVAAVRNPDKTQDLAALGVVLRQADYEQPAQWPAALQGVEKVLLISASDVGSRTRQHKVVIDAIAAAASVQLLAYTSILRADSCRIPYASEDRQTERTIKDTGKGHVFLRHSWYTENYLMNVADAVREGSLFGAAKNGRVSGAARADYAEAAARVLVSAEHLKSVYELAGDSAFTLADVAAELSRQSGRPVQYVDMPEAEYQALLVSFGIPQGLAATLAMADTGVAQGDVYSDSSDLRQLLGRPTTPLAEVVARALNG